MSCRRKFILAIAVALAVVMTPTVATAATGDVDDFTFESVHVDYTLTEGADGSGHLHVVETFVATFTHPDMHRGMRRILPTTFNSGPLRPTLLSITDENGTPRHSQTDYEDDSYLMTSRGDDYVIGEQTYVFTYTMENVARHFADTNVNEFYWDALGAEWAQPFGHVSLTLHVDEAIAQNLTGAQTCVAGYSNSTDACDIVASPDGQTIEVEAGALKPRQGVTIAIGFEPGTFTPFDNSYLANGMTPIQLGLVGLGGLGVFGTLVARRTALRDAPGHPTIIAQYEPPRGVDALNAAVMLRRPAGAIPAEILEQAVRGTIQIREKQPGSDAYIIVLIDKTPAGDDNGQKMIDILFGAEAEPGATVDLATQTTLSEKLATLATEAEMQQRAGGVRFAPAVRWRIHLPLALIAVAALTVVVGAVMTNSSGNPTGAIIGGVAVAVALVCAVLLRKRPYTAFGAGLRDHLLGLKLFMTWAEADRIRMLQSPEGAERMRVNTGDPTMMLKLYEPLLPFAVAFGIDKEWSKNLQTYYEQSDSEPGWYAGSVAFSAVSLHSMVSSFTPASSSSSSSGGSAGGGFVGGGGGGGGGGGV